ncbi:MAG TPA: FAD-dependent oxidoreductase [Luteitalea sp.]|nr:FAD-dependent oxidoreductase [Luteitalea sp.]
MADTTEGGQTPEARIRRGDARYDAVVNKRFNRRFTAQPDYVRLAASTSDVVAAVQDAVTEGRRLVVTSGGHCLENFVSTPDVRVILDVSPMKRIAFDADRRAIMVEAGATVGETFRALHDSWGTVLPLGEYPGVGIGGHVAGGAFGFLCRQFGLVADYLHGVELVTVNAQGRAQVVVATREQDDPHRDLWWGFTGAGGGNFGVATRYWFRMATATGSDPAALLPPAPPSIHTFQAEWRWDYLDERSFARLLRNHGTWSERNSRPDSPQTSLWTLLAAHRRQAGRIVVRGVSTAGEAAAAQARDYVQYLDEGVGAASEPELARLSWLDFALNPFPELFTMPPGGVRTKGKDALLKTRLTDLQIRVAYDHLTTDDDVPGGMLGLATYGGRVNAVAPDATASPHRSAIFDMACTTGWMEPADDGRNLAWVRAFYRDMFAATGGAPIPGDAYDGALINHPDVDLADPAWNRSGVPWSAIYFHDNYHRLQQVKVRWDPLDVFHHALSIRAKP